MSASKASEPDQTRRVRKLRFRIGEADQLQSLRRDPNLIAVETEQGRRRTLAGLWLFLALGLVFTTAGVQRFLAGNTTPADPLWWAAWTVEPMFAGLLIVLLNFEATILAHGIEPDSLWWSRIKAVLLGSTLFMNVIPQLAPLVGAGTVNVGSLAVHAIIPIIVYGLAEVIPVIQARARRVVLDGYADADHHQAPEPEPTPEPEPAPPAPAPTSAEPELPAASEPPVSEPAPAPAPAAVKVGSVKLPPQMVDKLAHTRQQVAAEGRELTAADVQRAVKVPGDMAERIAAEYTTRNGHAFT